MTGDQFDKCLVAYHEYGNDYRYVFTREQAAEIKKALDQRALIDEIRDLVKEVNSHG